MERRPGCPSMGARADVDNIATEAPFVPALEYLLCLVSSYHSFGALGPSHTYIRAYVEARLPQSCAYIAH